MENYKISVGAVGFGPVSIWLGKTADFVRWPCQLGRAGASKLRTVVLLRVPHSPQFRCGSVFIGGIGSVASDADVTGRGPSVTDALSRCFTMFHDSPPGLSSVNNNSYIRSDNDPLRAYNQRIIHNPMVNINHRRWHRMGPRRFFGWEAEGGGKGGSMTRCLT